MSKMNRYSALFPDTSFSLDVFVLSCYHATSGPLLVGQDLPPRPQCSLLQGQTPRRPSVSSSGSTCRALQDQGKPSERTDGADTSSRTLHTCTPPDLALSLSASGHIPVTFHFQVPSSTSTETTRKEMAASSPGAMSATYLGNDERESRNDHDGWTGLLVFRTDHHPGSVSPPPRNACLFGALRSFSWWEAGRPSYIKRR
jgi:hypothetical protein